MSVSVLAISFDATDKPWRPADSSLAESWVSLRDPEGNEFDLAVSG
jgi:hypothetical protein